MRLIKTFLEKYFLQKGGAEFMAHQGKLINTPALTGNPLAGILCHSCKCFTHSRPTIRKKKTLKLLHRFHMYDNKISNQANATRKKEISTKLNLKAENDKSRLQHYIDCIPHWSYQGEVETDTI